MTETETKKEQTKDSKTKTTTQKVESLEQKAGYDQRTSLLIVSGAGFEGIELSIVSLKYLLFARFNQ